MVISADAIEYCFKRKHKNPLQKDNNNNNNNNADILELTFYVQEFCDLHISTNLKLLAVQHSAAEGSSLQLRKPLHQRTDYRKYAKWLECKKGTSFASCLTRIIRQCNFSFVHVLELLHEIFHLFNKTELSITSHPSEVPGSFYSCVNALLC